MKRRTVSSKPLQPSPFLLYGYGSYEISIDPTFSSLRLSLLDRGVIFAIAHIRGGGEMGRSWYEMGRLAQKPTTFSDFIAVARELIDTGWTTSEQLGDSRRIGRRASDGRRHERRPGTVSRRRGRSPLRRRRHHHAGRLAAAYDGRVGGVGQPRRQRYQLSHHEELLPLRQRARRDGPTVPRLVYPRLFASGGLNDSRVGFWEPAKWVLKLRDANPDNYAVLKMEMGAGHGGVSGRYDAWRDEAQVLAWILNEITSVPLT